MKNINSTLIVLMVFLCLSSCQAKSHNKEIDFLELYPGVNFNSEIILAEDPFGANNGYLGSEIDLLLQNQSSKKISFALSEDVFIYTYSEKQQRWVQIVNEFKYQPGQVIIYPKGTNDITNAMVFVGPEIYDFNTPVTIRVVAIGHQIINDNEIKEVGAYFDADLVPIY